MANPYQWDAITDGLLKGYQIYNQEAGRKERQADKTYERDRIDRLDRTQEEERIFQRGRQELQDKRAEAQESRAGQSHALAMDTGRYNLDTTRKKDTEYFSPEMVEGRQAVARSAISTARRGELEADLKEEEVRDPLAVQARRGERQKTVTETSEFNAPDAAGLRKALRKYSVDQAGANLDSTRQGIAASKASVENSKAQTRIAQANADRAAAEAKAMDEYRNTLKTTAGIYNNLESARPFLDMSNEPLIAGMSEYIDAKSTGRAPAFVPTQGQLAQVIQWSLGNQLEEGIVGSEIPAGRTDLDKYGIKPGAQIVGAKVKRAVVDPKDPMGVHVWLEVEARNPGESTIRRYETPFTEGRSTSPTAKPQKFDLEKLAERFQGGVTSAEAVRKDLRKLNLPEDTAVDNIQANALSRAIMLNPKATVRDILSTVYGNGRLTAKERESSRRSVTAAAEKFSQDGTKLDAETAAKWTALSQEVGLPFDFSSFVGDAASYAGSVPTAGTLPPKATGASAANTGGIEFLGFE